MKILRFCSFVPLVALIAAATGCSSTPQAADVSRSLRTSLDQAGLKGVSVGDDRDKGVVTLGGSVTADADKAQAETIAKSLAGTQVVANQIAVLPPGGVGDARKMGEDLDKGIESNLDAALIANKLRGRVQYSVRNNVVTLTGNVVSEAERTLSEQVASTVPNVQQVVNELQVRKQKATSSN
jgi:osmotically-inducible protein OsmY